jgi:hypothetical protein
VAQDEKPDEASARYPASVLANKEGEVGIRR